MLNVKRLILLGLCIVMFGCTGLPPAPEEQYYSELVKEFPQAKSAIYSIKAYWYPDTYIQKFTSNFGNNFFLLILQKYCLKTSLLCLTCRYYQYHHNLCFY